MVAVNSISAFLRAAPTSQLHAKAVESHVLRTCAPRFEKSDRVRFSLEALGIGGTCAAFVDDDDSACGLNLRQRRLKGDFGDDNSSREFA